MPTYKVEINLQSIMVSTEADSVAEAIEKAETAFYHSISHGMFEIDYSQATSKED